MTKRKKVDPDQKVKLTIGNIIDESGKFPYLLDGIIKDVKVENKSHSKVKT